MSFDAQSVAIFVGLGTIALTLLAGFAMIVSAMFINKSENVFYGILAIPLLLLAMYYIGANYYIAGQTIVADTGINMTNHTASTYAGYQNESYKELATNNFRLYNINLRFFLMALLLSLVYITLMVVSWIRFKRTNERGERGF